MRTRKQVRTSRLRTGPLTSEHTLDDLSHDMKLAPKFRGANHQHLLCLGCIKNPDGYCELERMYKMVHAFRGINGLDCHRSSH